MSIRSKFLVVFLKLGRYRHLEILAYKITILASNDIILSCSKRRYLFVYGKWIESLRACEPSLYDEVVERLKREAKSPQNSPGHKKVLAKLHSLKVGAFKPSHQDAIDESSGDGEETPAVVEEIPGSTLLWEANARPANSADVCTNFVRNIYVFS